MRALMILLLGLLTGCTTLVSKEQCEHLNWYGRGYVDAQRERPLSFGKEYVATCRSHGVYLDITPWQRGYQKSLRQSCPAYKARELASQQQTYQGNCLQNPEFAQVYREAYKQAREQAALQQDQQQLEQLRAQIKQLEGRTDSAAQQKLQQLRWQEYQLQESLLESRPPMAVEAEVLNPELHR